MKEEFLKYLEELEKASPDVVLELKTENIQNFIKALIDTEVKPKPLVSDKGRAVLEAFKNFKTPVKGVDVATAMGKTPKSVIPCITKLVADGFVEKTGTTPACYFITQKGKDLLG